MILQSGKANVIIGGQWGSEGKGKVAGYLALRNRIDAAVCSFQTNAGHTWTDGKKKIVFQQLPAAAVNQDCILFITAAASITVDRLLQEIEEVGVQNRLFIDPMALIIEDRHREKEQEELMYISSTRKGCGAALAEKIMRGQNVKTAAKEPRLKRWVDARIAHTLHSILGSGGTILVESAQGFDLSLNHGRAFPFTTSRDISPAMELAHAGLPASLMGSVIGCLRAHPIRVGNIHDEEGNQIGHSGPHYDDHHEITWEELGVKSEITTVTKKIRRVFSFSKHQALRFGMYCAPTHLYLGHADYIDAGVEGRRTMAELTKPVIKYGQMVQEAVVSGTQIASLMGKQPKLSLIGTGPEDDSMVEVT